MTMAKAKKRSKLGKKRVTAKVAGKRMCCTRQKGKKSYVCSPKPAGAKKCHKARKSRKARKS
jgi:hypothetical protein